jgi:predicted nicotinamide N-methyase
MSENTITALAQRYPLVETTLTLGGKAWNITAVEDQDALIQGVQTEADLAAFPYGMMLWASAIGLSARLTEEPALVAGKRVMEIGAGVGLVGLVARSLGGNVTQTDYLPDILTLCRHNAAQNQIAGIDCRLGDWRDWPAALTDFDIVLGADIFYERTLHDTLALLLPRLLRPGGGLIVSDPLRPQAMELAERLEAQGNWEVAVEGRKVEFGGEIKDIGLFLLRRG